VKAAILHSLTSNVLAGGPDSLAFSLAAEWRRLPSEGFDMRTPGLDEIAVELNRRASTHPIGALQELRGHRPGLALFRLNAMRDDWACHWGGRRELQFNIGFDSTSSKARYLRHGVAFSFEQSREYQASELVATLRPKVERFNTFVRRYPKLLTDMDMWAYEYRTGDHTSLEPGAVPSYLVAERNFIFLGKYEPIHQLNYERVLDQFDELLPLYQYVEKNGKNQVTSTPLEKNFAFRPGCRTKKRSAVVRNSREQVERDLRHNELEKIMYRRLARQFGRENVGTEIAGKNGISIDLVVRRKAVYWFYEIKTAESARACIREALGQILEYAFWPGAQEAARLFVAGECAMDEDAETYLRCLRKRFKLPISYEHVKT
jgi:hypothetical protein